MAQSIILKRSSLAGKVPDTGSLNLGEVAVNTYDGKLYFKKSGSIESVESIVTTNSSISGSIRLSETGSFGSLKVNDTLTVNHGTTIISGSQLVTSDLIVLGAVNAKQFNINIISSSTIYQSGSTKFGDTTDDKHEFTGSIDVSGSLYLNGIDLSAGNNSGSFSGSFQGIFAGDGSGLRNVVTDDLPIDGWDYDSNSSASISEFNSESKKYLIDFQWEQEVGTPIGFKTFISNVTGSTQIVPTTEGIKFIVGNELVATVGAEGINATLPNGLISSSAQLTSSYDSRYVLSGSITQTTWDNIASKPSGILSSSAQITLSDISGYTTLSTSVDSRLDAEEFKSTTFATTGSNTFIGNQNITGSIIPGGNALYDLGTYDNQFRHLYLSSGSLYINGTKVLGSSNQELQITTDNGQSFKILEGGSDTITLQSSDGNIELKSSGNGDVILDPNTGVIGVKGPLTMYSGNKILSSDGNAVQFGNSIGITGSIVSSLTPLVSGSSQIDLTQTTGYSTFSSSVNSRVLNFENNSGTYATTGSNTFYGTQVITGSLYVSSNLIVQGSSSIQNITASAVSIGTNTILLNTANPAVRYGGISVIDSGSSASTGSLLWDSTNNVWIYSNPSGASYASARLIAGPKSSTLGDELGLINNRIAVAVGDDHISSSQIIDDGTTVSIPGNLTVTGSITGYATSASVASATATSINTLSASVYQTDATQSTNLTSFSSSINSRVITIEGKYATTGSNQFNGNQTITGSVYISGNMGIGSGATSPQQQLQLGDSTVIGYNANGTYVGTNFGTATSDKYINTNPSHQIYFDSVFGTMKFRLAGGGSPGSSIYWNTAINISNTGTTTFGGNVIPDGNGTRDLGASSARWSTIYTSDLSLNNGIGDWTIVEGEDDLFLYNNKKGKVYKFALTEVEPSVATPKMS